MSGFRTAYDGDRCRVAIDFGDEESRTKQSFKDECDINRILDKFQRTGVIEHVRRHGPEYGYAPSIDFKEAMDIVAKGQSMFEDLPSSLRNRFGTPEAFLEFVQNDDNYDEAVVLGLVERRAVDSLEPSNGVSDPAAAGDDEGESA